ncbi:MAG: hypothetical protein WC788_07280 [Candidatus Paceibacterota bacterium]|jgi:hypothetical protein
MKYTARIVFCHNDEHDDNLWCEVYDVKVNAESPEQAVEIAEKEVAMRTASFTNPASNDLVSVTDEEKGRIYVMSGDKLTILSPADHHKLPTEFSVNGQSFHVIDKR